MSRLDGRAMCGKPKRNGQPCENEPGCVIHAHVPAPDAANCIHAISRGNRGLCRDCLTDAHIAAMVAAVAAERERVAAYVEKVLLGALGRTLAEDIRARGGKS